MSHLHIRGPESICFGQVIECRVAGPACTGQIDGLISGQGRGILPGDVLAMDIYRQRIMRGKIRQGERSCIVVVDAGDIARPARRHARRQVISEAFSEAVGRFDGINGGNLHIAAVARRRGRLDPIVILGVRRSAAVSVHMTEPADRVPKFSQSPLGAVLR